CGSDCCSAVRVSGCAAPNQTLAWPSCTERVTCSGPRCSGESCREADWIPWCAIHVTLAPSSSVQALEPTGELRAIVELSDARADPTWGGAINWAAVSAAVAATAVGAAVGAVDGPLFEAAVDGLAFGSAARFSVSREPSKAPLPASLPPLPRAAMVAPGRPFADEPSPADADGGADAEAAVGAAAGGPPTSAPASAAASALSRGVSALDTGSEAPCFAAGWLGSSASEAALAFAAAVLAGTAAADGVAASD